MKKILLSLVALGVISAANAATTSTTLNLNGNLASSCTAGLSAGTLNFTFVPGTTTNTQNSVYTLSCTAGSVIGTFAATSANQWQFLGTVKADLIPYAISAVTAAPYVADIATTWSGTPATPGEATVDLIAAGSGTVVITDTADAVVSTLTITPGNTPASTNVDTYADTVTIATIYS